MIITPLKEGKVQRRGFMPYPSNIQQRPPAPAPIDPQPSRSDSDPLLPAAGQG